MSREVPELRIPDDLWTGAKSRQKQTRDAMKKPGASGVAKRPQYLFSGLTKCGVCGASEPRDCRCAREGRCSSRSSPCDTSFTSSNDRAVAGST